MHISASRCPPISFTNVLSTKTLQAAGSSTSSFPENTAISSTALPDLHISGLLDAAVREYSTWQQSRLSEEALNAEVRKACEVTLDDGLDLVQIDEDRNSEYFTEICGLSTAERMGSPVLLAL